LFAVFTKSLVEVDVVLIEYAIKLIEVRGFQGGQGFV